MENIPLRHLDTLRRHRRALMVFFGLLALLLITRAAILTVGNANKIQSSLMVMNRSPQSFRSLDVQIDKLQRITSDIENYKLSEIKNALETTANLARNSRLEFQAQYNAWVNVKSEISKDKKDFINLRLQLDEVQKLQNDEIVRLRKLLDESTKPSLLADSISLFTSFILGVLSSIIASHLYVKWQNRHSQKNEQNNA